MPLTRSVASSPMDHFRQKLMKTIADRAVLASLEQRLRGLRADTSRRWGTLTAHQMLCHLGDATAMVSRERPRRGAVEKRTRRLVKGLLLWSVIPWPHGWPTNPQHNPMVDGTQPTDFVSDLARAIAGLHRIALAKPGSLEPVHGFFGNMSARDWQRWAFRHTDHHLRQFGL